MASDPEQTDQTEHPEQIDLLPDAYDTSEFVAPTKPYHTKGKDDWGTPDSLYSLLNHEFLFDLDVCADVENAKCSTYLTKEMDSLHINWWGRCFMNPPFTLLDKFLSKMIRELMAGRIDLGVALVAARTDTHAMFTASCYAGEIRCLKGRVQYLVYPTPWQRACCETLKGVKIDAKAWPTLIENIKLPKHAIKALMHDPNLPGGHPALAQSAPFPSVVLIFDKRPQQSMVFWDWKQKLKTSYIFGKKEGGPISTGKPPLSMQKVPNGMGGHKLVVAPGKPYTPGQTFTVGKVAESSTPAGAMGAQAQAYTEYFKTVPLEFPLKYPHAPLYHAYTEEETELVKKAKATHGYLEKLGIDPSSPLSGFPSWIAAIYPGWEDPLSLAEKKATENAIKKLAEHKMAAEKAKQTATQAAIKKLAEHVAKEMGPDKDVDLDPGDSAPDPDPTPAIEFVEGTPPLDTSDWKAAVKWAKEKIGMPTITHIPEHSGDGIEVFAYELSETGDPMAKQFIKDIEDAIAASDTHGDDD